MLRLSSFRFLSTITKYSNSGRARETTAPWGWSCIHNIHFAPRAPFVSGAYQLPQPPCRTVVGRGERGRPSLRAVGCSCQAQLLEIWVTVSKNARGGWPPAPLRWASRAGWCSACSAGRSLARLAQCPVPWESGGEAAASARSLQWLELESQASLGVGSDGHSPLLCASLGESLPLLGFASG